MVMIYKYEKIQLESVFFAPSCCLTVLCAHIIVSGDFQRKSAKKRPLLFETMGTNTGLNMQNEPAVDCRLGLNHFHNLFMFM